MMMNPLTSSPVSSPRRSASRSTTRYVTASPIAYMIPYQWTSSGPSANAIGWGVQLIIAAVYRRAADPVAGADRGAGPGLRSIPILPTMRAFVVTP